MEIRQQRLPFPLKETRTFTSCTLHQEAQFSYQTTGKKKLKKCVIPLYSV